MSDVQIKTSSTLSERIKLWNKLKKSPGVPPKEALLEKIENKTENAPITVSLFSAMITPLSDQSLLDQFLNTIPQLIGLLDDISKTHVFIAVALAPFKAVYASERKRRENNKRVMLLFLEMRDMMAVILQIADINDADVRISETETLQGRMQTVMSTVDAEIKTSYTICEAYMKQRLIAKVWNASGWEDQLADCTKRFVRLREAIVEALASHTARGVDRNEKLLKSLDESVDKIYRLLLRKLPANGEQDIAEYIASYPGDRAKLLKDDDTLEFLCRIEGKNQAVAESKSGASESTQAEKDKRLKQLRDDIGLDIETILKQNLNIFEGKLAIQLARVENNTSDTINRTGDRVIDSLTQVIERGPGELITNSDMYNVWRYMGWRASVKSVHFILALRDYYMDSPWIKSAIASSQILPTQVAARPRSRSLVGRRKSEPEGERRRKDLAGIPHAVVDPSDEWTLQCIRIDCLRNIVDAVDTDASGFITIKEINEFTQSRPKDWSLLKWIAYWAVGWEDSLLRYWMEIKSLFGQIFALLHRVMPENRVAVDKYLELAWDATMVMCMGIVRPRSSISISEESFADYIADEERRLEASLDHICYNIRDADTVRLVIEGPLERSIAPLLYLLAKRLLDVANLSTYGSSSPDHIEESLENICTSLQSVVEEHQLRAQEVSGNLRNQRRNTGDELKSFAGGLYRHALQESDVFTPQKLKELDNSSSIETLNVPDMRIISLEWSPRSKEPEEVVNLPSDDDCDVGSSDPTVTFLDASDWLERLQTCTPSDDPTPLILGEWSGYTTAPGYNEMQHYVFKPSPSGFQGLGQYYRGENFSLSGNCIFDPSGKINITFNKTYTDESYYSFRYTGVLDRDSGVFSGTFKAVMEPEEEEGEGYEFTFRRVSPEILSRRPPLLDFNANRPQALWHFATSVTLDHLKRTSWSTAYFANRFTTRKRCMDLFLMREIHGSDTTAGVELFRTIVPREFQYYWRLFQKRREQMLGQCPHHEVLCDVCGFSIIGPRITCLECPRADIGRVDLCPTHNCISTDVTWSRLRQQQRSHSACHALLRLTSVLHKGVEALTLDNAKHAVERAKQLVVDEDEAKEEKDPQAVLQRTAPTAKASRPELRCAVCHNTLGSSFWYCADCEETVVLCEKCGVEEIHHDTHLLVRYSKVKEASRDIASSFDQQFSAFQRKMESSFDQQSLAFQRKLSNMRKEITEELQSVQNEVEYKLDRIERLLLKIAGEREEGISDPV